MPFKTMPASDAPFLLPGMSVLAVEGPQAGAFLQAQAMNDVAALAIGRWHWNGWLTAKGRVIALFALLRTDEAAYRLVLPDFPAGELRAALARFVFRSRLTLAVDATACAGEWTSTPTEAATRDAALRDGDAWALDLSGDGAARRLWLLPADRVAATDADAAAAWREADLRHGLPRLSAAQREAWTPQMLSLQRLRAYSLRKGCYPGQEIVARTHYLGQAKRELVLVRGEGLVEGAALADAAGASVGSIVSAAADARLALAVVNAGSVDASAVCAGREVERIALADGLQRPA